MLLSGDDEVFPGAIERIEHYAEGADWLFGDLEFIDAAGNPTGLQTHEWMPTDPKAALAKTFAQHSVAITMFSAFRLSWLRENHLRGEEFVGTRAFSDTATCVRWLEANPRIRRIPHPLFRYRQHPDQESNTAGDARAMMNAELDAWPRL